MLLSIGCLTPQPLYLRDASAQTTARAETEVADTACYLTQSQETDTRLTSPNTDPMTPVTCQESHRSANFPVTGMTDNVSYQLAPILKHSDFPMETKSKIINSISVPILTYQCQTWAMAKPLERKMTTCEMRCLRKAVNKTKRDMIHHIQQQKIKWFGHLIRLSIHHPAQRAYNTKFSGCKAGRPRNTWINGVKETLSLYNIPPAQAFRRAADKRLFLSATPQVV